MTTFRAHVATDWVSGGVGVGLVERDPSTGASLVYVWGGVDLVSAPADGAYVGGEGLLRLPDGAARALYEALGDHFGHTGHDMRALRKDYDAERGRVDRLIGAIVGTVKDQVRLV